LAFHIFLRLSLLLVSIYFIIIELLRIFIEEVQKFDFIIFIVKTQINALALTTKINLIFEENTVLYWNG